MADHQLKNEIQSLKSALDGLRDDVSGIMDTLRRSGETHFDELQERVRDDVKRGRKSIRQQARKAREAGRHALDDVEENIGQHPYTTVATAFGIGFVVAKLIEYTSRRVH